MAIIIRVVTGTVLSRNLVYIKILRYSIAAYAAALNECGMSLATTFEDEPFTYDNGEPLYNADRQYHGTVTMRAWALS